MSNLSLASLSDDLNAQVVDRINGRDVTRGELSKAFNRVANATNWKLAIDARVDVANDFDLELIRRAVMFFAGSRATFEPVAGGQLPGCRYRVRAAGYYADVGA